MRELYASDVMVGQMAYKRVLQGKVRSIDLSNYEYVCMRYFMESHGVIA